MTILYILNRQYRYQVIRFLSFLALGVLMPISIVALNIAKRITTHYVGLSKHWFPASQTPCDTCTEGSPRQCMVCAFCSNPATIEQLRGAS
jgi:hypothetical protein